MSFDFLNSKPNISNIADEEMALRSAQNNTVVNHITGIRSFIQNNYLDDPLFLGYRPFFHYAETSGLLAPENYTNSALAYLKRIGEETRYTALKQFIRLLQKVNIDMPYMFQTIEGLQEAKANFNYPILNENNFITFGMLESLDMRIQSLLQTYKMVAYDNIRQIWVLPRNLRQFSMSVIVYPTGAYNVSTQEESLTVPNSKLENTGLPNSADAITKFNHVLFEFSQCEIDIINSSVGFFDTVNNAELTEASTTIGITYKRVRESGLFHSLLGSTNVSGANLNIAAATKQKISGNRLVNFLADAGGQVTQDLLALKERYSSVSAIKEGFKSMFGNAAQYVANNAQAFLANQIGRLYLGNVYETSVADIVALANSRGIENTIINLGRALNTDNTRNTSGQSPQTESNVYK